MSSGEHKPASGRQRLAPDLACARLHRLHHRRGALRLLRPGGAPGGGAHSQPGLQEVQGQQVDWQIDMDVAGGEHLALMKYWEKCKSFFVCKMLEGMACNAGPLQGQKWLLHGCQLGLFFRNPGPLKDLFAYWGPYWVFISLKRSFFFNFIIMNKTTTEKYIKSCIHLKRSKKIFSGVVLVYKTSKI